MISISPARARCLEPLDIFVLAGGQGTRIRPVLGDKPKLLAPIAGRPYLDHLLNWLRRFGARRIVLGLGHQAQAVIEYLDAHPAHDLSLATVVEPRPLGTAGAIRFARATLRTDPVLVMNGDSFADADLCMLLAGHKEIGACATLLCAKMEDAGRYGRVVLGNSGRIKELVEKDPTFRGAALVNAGVYMISSTLLDEIAVGTAVSLEHDVFERLPAESLAAFTGCSQFIDIGVPESIAHAGEFFRTHAI